VGQSFSSIKGDTKYDYQGETKAGGLKKTRAIPKKANTATPSINLASEGGKLNQGQIAPQEKPTVFHEAVWWKIREMASLLGKSKNSPRKT